MNVYRSVAEAGKKKTEIKTKTSVVQAIIACMQSLVSCFVFNPQVPWAKRWSEGMWERPIHRVGYLSLPIERSCIEGQISSPQPGSIIFIIPMIIFSDVVYSPLARRFGLSKMLAWY